MSDLPLIRVELEGIRQTMVHAFSNTLLELDSQFKTAIDRALDPDRVQEILDDEAKKALDFILTQETRRFFSSGRGLKSLRELVSSRLEQMYPNPNNNE